MIHTFNTRVVSSICQRPFAIEVVIRCTHALGWELKLISSNYTLVMKSVPDSMKCMDSNNTLCYNN